MTTFRKALLALLLSIATANLGYESFADDIRVYFFTSQHCPPCRQMEPVVERLISEGYPVSKVDAARDANLVRQFSITQTPTTVIVSGGQTQLARQSGLIGYLPLKQKLDELLGSSARNNSASKQHVESRPAWRSQNAQLADYTQNQNPRNAEQLAFQATVRLKVVDPQGSSFATGTVIHVHGEDALILTCGHVFRESKGTGKIHVDVGFGGQITTVPGTLLDYDADAHDIALVTFKPGIPVQPVKLARSQMNLQHGEMVFSIGCDSAQDPSIRRSKLKKVNRYNGVVKYDVYGRPVYGRSGGGLFTADGQLIGVCNAAVVDVDEGIYAAIPTIYWQIAQVNLGHLFQGPAGRDLIDSRSQIAGNAPTNTRASQQVATNSNNPASRNPVARTREVPGEIGEIIVLVRNPHDPTQTETITIPRPSDELIDMIRIAQSEHLNVPGGARVPRNLPNIPSEIRGSDSGMRAQSPK